MGRRSHIHTKRQYNQALGKAAMLTD